MSIDIVDDLHCAEDLAGVLARALEAVLNPALGFDAQASAVDALAEYSGYCRPSCGYLDGGVCEADDPEDCGCICGHADAADPLLRVDPHIHA